MGFKVNRLNLSFGFDNGYIYDAKYHVTFPNLCLFFWKWGDFVSCGCFEEGHDTDKNLWQIINNMKRQKDKTLKDELPRSVGTQYDFRDQWRTNSRKNEEREPSKNNTQLWIWWMMEVKSDAIKSNIAYEPRMFSPRMKANWKLSNRKWQEWTLTL